MNRTFLFSRQRAISSSSWHLPRWGRKRRHHHARHRSCECGNLLRILQTAGSICGSIVLVDFETANRTPNYASSVNHQKVASETSSQQLSIAGRISSRDRI